MKIQLPKPNPGLLLLIGAIVFGCAAVFLARVYIQDTLSEEKQKLAPTVDLVEIVVAKADLPPGAVVSAETMAIRQIPREYLSGATVTPDAFDIVAGSSLTIAIRQGEPLLKTSVAGTDGSTFSARIKDGSRAITLPVDEVNSISGLLQPGDRVDLLLTAKQSEATAGDAQARDQTICLLQDVAVLATGQELRPASREDGKAGDGGRFSTVTVQLSPADASKMVVAQQAGKITAILRGRDDRARAPCVPRDIASLFPRPARRAQSLRGPEIIVGGRGEVSRTTIALPAGMSPLQAESDESKHVNPTTAGLPTNSPTN